MRGQDPLHPRPLRRRPQARSPSPAPALLPPPWRPRRARARPPPRVRAPHTGACAPRRRAARSRHPEGCKRRSERVRGCARMFAYGAGASASVRGHGHTPRGVNPNLADTGANRHGQRMARAHARACMCHARACAHTHKQHARARTSSCVGTRARTVLSLPRHLVRTPHGTRGTRVRTHPLSSSPSVSFRSLSSTWRLRS